MNKDEFERWFDTALQETAKKQEFVPSSDQSWMRLQAQLQRKSKRKFQLKILPYVAASFLLGAIIFGTPTVSNAFDPIYKAIVSIKDEAIKIIFGSEDNKVIPQTSPPPEEGAEEVNDGGGKENTEFGQEEYDSWEEASKAISFNIPSIAYTPEDYKLETIFTFSNGSKKETIAALFKYMNANQQIIKVTIRKLTEQEQIASDSKQADKAFERITINNSEAILFSEEGGLHSIEFPLKDMYIIISGEISRHELIQIAQEIK
ncbi:DUF4367 domain-containing protein [Paenibacillus chungangensis]|uniref:DUF4367 domain-containing protein n=1 Tax=Paenibacillus chungangensis TaxID=696535 RepID=A0ABW3HL01_9BACL